MSGSLSVALSGLNADSAALDIVGNNLANLNTTGYKDSTASFYDLLSQSVGGGSVQIGGGVSATHSSRQFTQGSIQLSGGEFQRCDPGERVLPSQRHRWRHVVYPGGKFPAQRTTGISQLALVNLYKVGRQSTVS